MSAPSRPLFLFTCAIRLALRVSWQTVLDTALEPLLYTYYCCMPRGTIVVLVAVVETCGSVPALRESTRQEMSQTPYHFH